MLGEDYMGKRKMYLGGMLLISLGMLLMFLSQSMAMAVVGQVLFGFFALALKRFSVALISDTTKPQLSEKFVSTLQGSYSIGAIIGPLAYQWLRHWRHVILYFSFLPFALLSLLCCVFLRDTPRYLLRKCTTTQAAKSLNFIARINNRQPL